MSLSQQITRTDGDGAPNGAVRNFGLYWCYHCHRTVRIASSNPSEITCPRCLRQFVVEIEMRQPWFTFNHAAPPFIASPEDRLLEALSLMFDPPIIGGFSADPFFRARSRNILEPEPRPRPHTRRRHSHDNVNNGGLPPPRRTYVILRPIHPTSPLGSIIVPPNPAPPQRLNAHDFSTGASGLEQLIEQLTQDDRPGPPPWLRLHNSCPICRRDLPPVNTIADSRESIIQDIPERRRPRRMQLGNIWPFRARYQRVSPEETTDQNPQGNRS